MNRIVVCLLAGLAMSTQARAEEVQSDEDFATLSAYLTAESARILLEGDRIRSEAELMRSEGGRLNREATELRTDASHLDAQWESARKSNPKKYRDYVGRNRSQVRMRFDAGREDTDAVQLRHEGRRLDKEAIRLWRLAAAVDPQAQKDLLERIRRCCIKAIGLEMLRTEISKMARAFGLTYSPQ
jgi:hypothetical protein